MYYIMRLLHNAYFGFKSLCHEIMIDTVLCKDAILQCTDYVVRAQICINT